MSTRLSLAVVCGALAPFLWIPVSHAAPAPGGTVWVVDDDGGVNVDATDLQVAADAAQEGDTLLVKAGVYGALDIDGKSLVIVADDMGAVTLDKAQLWIHNLGPSQTVVVRGLQVTGGIQGPTAQRVPLRLAFNQGHVWLEDCIFTNTDAISPGNPVLTSVPGASIANSAAVTLVRCGFRGSKQVYTSSPFSWTMAGIHAVNSVVVIHESQLEGSDGAGGASCFGNCPGVQGGPGLTLDGGLAFISNSTLSGGQGLPGGDGTTLLNCGQGGLGGHAVVTVGAGPGSLTLIGTTLTPGTGGLGGTHPSGFTCNDGSGGVDFADFAGIGWTTLPGPAPRAQVDATTTALGLATLEVTGQPGDFAFLFIAGAPNVNLLFALAGVVSIAPPQFLLATAQLDGAGEATLSLLAPPVPGFPGVETFTFYLQLAHIDAGLQLELGGPTVWTVLDAAF